MNTEQDIYAVDVSSIDWLGDWELLDWEPKTNTDWARIRRKERKAGNTFCHWSYFCEEPHCDLCDDSTTAKILTLNRYERMYQQDGLVVCETCLAEKRASSPNG